MNTFNITLSPFSDRDSTTGCTLSFRSADAGNVEIWTRVPKPRKGQTAEQFEDVCLGRVHNSDLARVLGAVHALMGGCQG